MFKSIKLLWSIIISLIIVLLFTTEAFFINYGKWYITFGANAVVLQDKAKELSNN